MKKSGESARMRNTRQKKVIADCIARQNGGHITAEQIEHILNEEGEKVGKATIYRCLKQLEEQGKIRKYTFSQGKSACYQLLTDPCCTMHSHLQCQKCGSVEHIENDTVIKMIKLIEDEAGFDIDAEKTMFYGLCRNCREGKK